MAPTTSDRPTGTDPTDDTAPSPRRRRPLGPLAIVVITLISASAALAFLLVAARSGDEVSSVDVRDALENLDVGPPVPEGASIAEVGRPAPDVRLDYLDGGVQQLSELRGTPVVLNFWASTCAPCLQEMPEFEQVSQDAGDALVVVGVDVADTEEAGNEMVRRTGVTYRNARDPRSEIFAVYGGTALPRTVLIDADGTVVDTHTGALDRAELTDFLRRNGVTW